MEPSKKPKPESAKVLANIKFSNPQDEAGMKTLPTLYDLLCPRWKAGALVRQPGKLAIRVEGGAYLVSIECPTEGLQTLVVVDSLASALADAEREIKAGTVNWVPSWARRKKSLPTLDELIE